MRRAIERRGRRRSALLAASALAALSLVSAPAAAACSEYLGYATINEFYSSGNTRFVELKLLDASIPASTYESWELRVCGASACESRRLAELTQTTSPWLVWSDFPNNVLGLHRNDGGVDAILRDADNNTIDYVSVRGLEGQRPTSCTPAYPWQAPSSSLANNPHSVYRLPDGTGEWGDHPGNSDGNTGGGANPGPPPPDGGEPVPTLRLTGTSVTAGQDASFTIDLAEGSRSYDVSVEYQTVDRSALAGTHYEDASGTATIPAGQTLVTVNVPTFLSPDTTEFALQIANPNFGTITNHFATASIDGVSFAPHHVQLIHSGSGLTCQREMVTVRICATSDCSELFADPVEVMLSPGAAGGNPVTVAGEAQVPIRHTLPGTITLAASSVPLAQEATQCISATGSGCQLDFHEAGFQLTVPPDAPACTASPGVLRALRADPLHPEQCVGDGGFAGRTVSVEFWSVYESPASGSRPLQVNGSAVAAAPASSAVALSFDGNAEAPLTVRYDDAGRMLLNARFVGTGEEAGLIMAGGTSFVSYPELAVDAYESTGAAMTVAGAPQPADRLHAAGQSFALQVRAQCADGLTTPNFQLADIAIEHDLLAPAGGVPGTLARTAFDLGAADGGELTLTDQALSEVGRHRLRIVPPDYLGIPLASASVIPAARFIPAYFDTLVLRHGCSDVEQTTYSGQPVGEVVVQARAFGGLPTLNYDGTLGAARMVTLADAGATPAGSLGGHQVPAAAFVQGEAFVVGDVAADSGVVYTFADPETAPYLLRLRAWDENGVSSADHLEGETEIRSARLRIVNVVGSERLPLGVRTRVESWQAIEPGVYAWDTEASDVCTALGVDDFVLENPQFHAGALFNPTIAGVVPLSGGVGEVTLGPAGDRGSSDLRAGLAGRYPWLRFDWRGTGVQDPSGRVAFGVFGGHPGGIYRVEHY